MGFQTVGGEMPPLNLEGGGLQGKSLESLENGHF